MRDPFETERLIIRKFYSRDAPFVYALLNSPGWLQFIGDRGVKTLKDASTYIENLSSHYNKHGFGPYLVSLKENSLPIGMCSLIKRETLEDVDIGFAFLPEFMGKGFAYEAAKGTYNFAKRNLGLKQLAAITNTNNIASINLLKKLGFTYIRNLVLPGETEEVCLFTDNINND
ncbi:MAG: GNAT family N-acetyltransferase [Bacteroidia bacterium]|nr:GNAT family N-acetyltransferase [Bacteroidia bacterium]